MFAATLAILALFQGKPSPLPSQLDALRTKISEIGEKGPIDKQVAAFLRLSGEDVMWHAKFDTERQVQIYDSPKEKRLIFLVPEKPFPEFGKTWLYSVGFDGKSLKAGVAEPRDAFKALPDAKANEKGLKAELAYWMKELGLSKV